MPVVFITTCTHRRQPLLPNDPVHAILREIWTRSGELNGWYVGQYVLMPDHVHLFASPGIYACSLAKWMQLWKTVAAKRINHTREHYGPVWQADYFDRYLRSLPDYDQKWAYVEMNPVRKGLVLEARQWAYRGIIHDLRSRKARDY